jgi:hypothetical protein
MEDIVEKWADYCINAVRYDKDETFIEKVTVKEDEGDSLGPEEIKKREWVVDKIEDGYTFVTTKKNNDGKWIKGEDVHVVKIKGKKYIRTDKNNTESDNLGNLPNF